MATDLDGTLLDAEGHVSAATREVLAELNDRGVPVVFVTGRPIRWMSALWDEIGDVGLAICSNGGLVFDVVSRQVRDVRALSGSVIARVVEQIRAAAPDAVLALETVDGFVRDSAWRPRDEDDVLGDVVTVDDLAAYARTGPAVVKLLALHAQADPEEFWRRIESALGDLAVVTWSSTGAMVEVSAAGVTKASALAEVCAELGVDAADVVAFGDMPNDIPMLTWAGTGYAMAGAHPVVRASADAVVGHHDRDGVAATLADIFSLAGWSAEGRTGDDGGVR